LLPSVRDEKKDWGNEHMISERKAYPNTYYLMEGEGKSAQPEEKKKKEAEISLSQHKKGKGITCRPGGKKGNRQIRSQRKHQRKKREL